MARKEMTTQQQTTTHECSVCNCNYTDDEGGIQGNFGMLPVSFCPTCFSCMCNMAEQYLDIRYTKPEDTIDPDHARLIEQLRGVRHIVINQAYGGFGLSHDARLSYLKKSGITYSLEDREDRDSTQRYGPRIMINGVAWHDNDIDRDDPNLVAVVRELGEKASGGYADLVVITIPADVKWEIDEYDGREWVSEKHRVWGR